MSATQHSEAWRQLFNKWPKEIPSRGVLVTTLNEQIPFRGFMITDEWVLLERTNPDPMGSRFIMLPFENIAVVKLIDALKQSAFETIGFVGKLSGK